MSVVLTRLMPEQVTEYWSFIKRSVEEALPPAIPVTEEVLTNIMTAAVDERIEIWMIHEDEVKDGSTPKIYAVGTTTIIEDKIAGIKSLLIYTLFGKFDEPLNKDWILGLDGLKKYARANGCSSISAYTQAIPAIKLAESFGADVKTRYVIFNV